MIRNWMTQAAGVSSAGSSTEHASVELRAGPFRLHADIWDGGQQENLLLLHGLGGNSITWHGAAPLLADRLSARVVAIDLPGFGASRTGGHRVNLDALANVALEVMRNQAVAGARWQLAGNSLGGLLALELAVRAPDVVERVTLAAAALPLTWGRELSQLPSLMNYVPAAMPMFGRRLVERYVRRTGVPGVVDDPVRMLFHDPLRLDVQLHRRLVEVSRYRMTWANEAARALEQTTLSLGLALLDPRRTRRWFGEMHCPVRSIYGTHDPLYPHGAWQRLAKVRPEWQHVSMAAVGHVPQLEAPHEFTGHMLAP